jgi:hypothetical protein
MLPTYRPNDTLLGWTWFTPGVGQVVVLSHAERPLIKRITKIDGTMIWVEGDNKSDSIDSRNFGFISRSKLKSHIIARLG